MEIQPNSLTLSFSNPEVIDDKEFSNLVTPDFKSEDTPEKKETRKEQEKLEKPGVDDSGEELKINLSPTTEEESEETTDSNLYVNVINTLADLGYKEVWDGFDENEPVTEETLAKFVEHNVTKKVEEHFEDFFGSLTEYSKKIISYDLNAKGEDVEGFLKTLIEENSIKSLSVENEYDQEKILRQWYKSEDKFTSEEINEKIGELKEAGLMEKEAKRIKPKLDLQAESIAKQKEEEQKMLREIENQASETYTNKVIETLKKGEIGGIKLNKDDITQIYSFLTNDEMQVTTHGGKKATMTPLEAIIFYNKYDKNGSIENLALATLLLTNPKKFEEVYSKRALTKVTNEVVNDIKKSNGLKIGGGAAHKPQKEEKENKYYPFPKI